MSKKIIIHIGTGKTGTTSIQNTLAQHRDALTGVVYPKIEGNYHHCLAALYQPFERLARTHVNKYGDAATLERARTALRAAYFKHLKRAERVILSSEFISRFNTEELDAFKRDLDAHGFTDVQVLVYLRDPTSYYLSLLQQYMKMTHETLDPDRFRCAYRRILSNYTKCFGPVITPVVFDRQTLHDGCVVRDFLRRCEDFLDTTFDPITPETDNQSVSCEALLIHQGYRARFHSHAHNRDTADSSRLFDTLQRCETWVNTTRLTLRPEIARLIHERNRSDVNWLYTHHGIDFRPAPDNLPPPVTRDGYDLNEVVMPPDPDALAGLHAAVLHELLTA